MANIEREFEKRTSGKTSCKRLLQNILQDTWLDTYDSAIVLSAGPYLRGRSGV